MSEERQVRVRWEIDVFDEDALSPLDAAQKAFATLLKPGTTATVFDVMRLDGTPIATVDLSAMAGEQVTLPHAAVDSAAQEGPGRLYVQWGNPFGAEPVVAVLRVSELDLDKARQQTAVVRQAGMVEGTFPGDAIRAYFVEGFEDADSGYAEVFAATTGLPAALFERLESAYEEHMEPQGFWIEGADAEFVVQRLESIKDMGYAERTSWGAAEVFAAEAVVAKARGEAFALYEHTDDRGRVSNFTVDFPLSADVPTLDLDAGVAPAP